MASRHLNYIVSRLVWLSRYTLARKLANVTYFASFFVDMSFSSGHGLNFVTNSLQCDNRSTTSKIKYQVKYRIQLHNKAVLDSRWYFLNSRRICDTLLRSTGLGWKEKTIEQEVMIDQQHGNLETCEAKPEHFTKQIGPLRGIDLYLH